MQTKVFPAERWRDALGLLLEGEIIALPTDTVYGIAAMPLSASAVDAIYAAKGRPAEKALPMLVAGLADAARIADLSADIRRLCQRYWPGALTVVAPSASGFSSPAIADDGTVALRMPALDLTLDIISAAGGVLAVTSANQSGEAPATTAAGVLAQLDGHLAAVIDGGPSPGGTPSSVIRMEDGRLSVVREGAINRETLEHALRQQP